MGSLSVSVSRALPGRTRKAPMGRKRTVVVQALFEKFTERSIKAIMIAQAEARNFGAHEVSLHCAGDQASSLLTEAPFF